MTKAGERYDATVQERGMTTVLTFRRNGVVKYVGRYRNRRAASREADVYHTALARSGWRDEEPAPNRYGVRGDAAADA